MRAILEDTRLLKTIGPIVMDIISEIRYIKGDNGKVVVNNGKLQTDKTYSDLSMNSRYALDVFHKAMEMINIGEKLQHILVYLGGFPKPKYYESNDVTKADYIKYHIENFYIRVATLLDQSSLLINTIYELGYPERKVNADSVLENLNIKNTRTGKILKAFKQGIQGVQKTWNEILHKGIFEDPDLLELSTFYFVNKHGGEEIVNPIQLAYLSNITLRNKQLRLNENMEPIRAYMVSLFNELEKEFSKRYQMKSNYFA